ncbi:MAG: amidase [Gemmatimonadetes bacterium]|nr:amidase [Gemmatimonadota bacterium]
MNTPIVRQLFAATLLLLHVVPGSAAAQVEVAEATIEELQEAMASGRATSVSITEAYLARIAAYDQDGPRLNALIRLNPNALAEAQALDRERAAGRVRGPLHGIPIILKDNYDTFDMPTSGATLALATLQPADDAFQVRRLRAAGAVIVGKSNLHELAYGITSISSLGGQTLNPYDTRRNPGGSSGGTGAAIAASFAAVGWGSDTCGSIRLPSSHNNLVGLRPTKGLSSIDGILPLSHTQDVGGPLARTVRDLAIALDATVGPDPADPATRALDGRTLPRFVDALDGGALRGARIGILENLFGGTPEDAAVTSVVRAALARMVAAGADTVTVEIPDYDQLISGSSVLALEFKWDLLDYLAAVPDAPVSSLAELIETGLAHESVVGTLRRSDTVETRDSDAYRAALAKREPLREAVVAAMDAARVDALAYPTIRTVAALTGEPQRGSNCQLSASTGMPAISAQAGWSGDLPVGIELLGRSLDDAHLVGLAYALEQAESQRRAPPSTPTLVERGSPRPVAFNVLAATADRGAQIRGRFEYDTSAGVLGYQLELTGLSAADVVAVVLRHTDEQGRPHVVARLAGPALVPSLGAVALTGDMRTRLERGELSLEMMTRAAPLGAARARVVLPQ